LIELRDAMTAEPGHIVLVDNFGMPRVIVVVVVVVVGGSEERLEICDEEETGCCFLALVNFNLQSSGSGYLIC